MNTHWTKTFVIGLIVTCCAMPLAAQDTGVVAILDVAKVFKENPNFDTKMKVIRDEASALKAQIQSEQDEIRKQAMTLENYEVGSVDRNNLEATLEQKQTALRTKARQSEQELLNREAKIYYDTYTQMQTVVASVAKEYNISLVLRFDSAAIDSTNRAEVIKGVNRAVVYHSKRDLTNLVIRAMNPGQASAQGANNK